MKAAGFLPALVAFALAAAGAVYAATLAVREIETRSVEGVDTALRDGGISWAKAKADGLRLSLIGTAP